MTITPFYIDDAARLYHRVSKLRPADIIEHEVAEPQDVVNISTEGKKRHIMDQTKNEVIERIKSAK